MSEYTPTTEYDWQYRAVHISGQIAGPWGPGDRAQIGDQTVWHEERRLVSPWRAVEDGGTHDDWLAAHDAKVRAAAIDEVMEELVRRDQFSERTLRILDDLKGQDA